jgi:hypothetical protein
LYLPHPCCLSFSPPGSNEVLQKKKLKHAPMPTRKCYCYCLCHLEVGKMKKKRHHSTFLPTLCLLLSHLAHSDEYPNNHWRKRLKTPHRSTKVEDRLPTSIVMFLFISLLLASSFFESRDEIPFKGGRFVTPWNFQFQDENRKNN